MNFDIIILFRQFLSNLLILGLPLLILLFFLISQLRYREAKRANAQNPGTFSPEEMTRRKDMYMISLTLLLIFAGVVVGLIALFYMGIAFM